MNNEIIEDLNSMVGRPWLYMGRTVQITGWEEADSIVIINTKKSNIRVPTHKIEDELAEFKSTSYKQVQDNEQSLLPAINDAESNVSKIETALMNTIERVDEDPDYMETAKTIQKQAKTVLDIQKFKLDVMKEMRKRGQV